MVPSGSQIFLFVFNDSQWFLVVSSGSQWFSMVLSVSHDSQHNQSMDASALQDGGGVLYATCLSS